MASPKTAQHACYFYSRKTSADVTFISYHFGQDAEVISQFADTALAVESLT